MVEINSKKKKRYLIFLSIVISIILCVILIIINKDPFIETTKRFEEVFNIQEVKCFFELSYDNSPILYEEIVNEIVSLITDSISFIVTKFQSKDEVWQNFLIVLESALDFLCNFLIYFCNIGLNVFMLLFIYFKETFDSEKINVNTTGFAKIYIRFCSIINLFIQFVVKNVKKIFSYLKRQRRIIALVILLYLLSNGFLYRLLIEIIIFLVVYILKAINLETYTLIFTMFKLFVVKLYPFLKNTPLLLYLPLIILLVFFSALSKAEYRLTKNHERLKRFVRDDLTQTTFINGPPGSGKTLLNVSLSLASEEMYIETLEKLMLDHELKYPYFNFALIRGNPDLRLYPEHKDYIDALLALSTRKSYIISNYAIYSPYFSEYSKIFNFDFLRKNKKSNIYALEEYNIISISELDKEYNSHDDMKRVGEDGAATFFSTVSHDLKRHVKVFCDYQLKDQVPLRIRGNSEYFFTINERKKKYPVLLAVYYLPIRALTKLFRHFILKYETRRPTLTKKTKRKTLSFYKRNDISFLYIWLRQTLFVLNKISDFFDHYWFYKIKGNLSTQDGDKGEEKAIDLNICDLSINNMALYDSTFLSFAYEQKKNTAFKDLDKFTSLTPTTEELTKCNSYFYNTLNGFNDDNDYAVNRRKNNRLDDDFIVINEK